MVRMRIMLVSALGEWPRRRSGMSDLHEARDPERDPEIDSGLAIFGHCCRYHSRRYDGCLQGPRHDGCEGPCVASSRALGLGNVLPPVAHGSLATLAAIRRANSK